jgi:hypothetical protein
MRPGCFPSSSESGSCLQRMRALVSGVAAVDRGGIEPRCSMSWRPRLVYALNCVSPDLRSRCPKRGTRKALCMALCISGLLAPLAAPPPLRQALDTPSPRHALTSPRPDPDLPIRRASWVYKNLSERHLRIRRLHPAAPPEIHEENPCASNHKIESHAARELFYQTFREGVLSQILRVFERGALAALRFRGRFQSPDPPRVPSTRFQGDA